MTLVYKYAYTNMPSMKPSPISVYQADMHGQICIWWKVFMRGTYNLAARCKFVFVNHHRSVSLWMSLMKYPVRFWLTSLNLETFLSTPDPRPRFLFLGKKKNKTKKNYTYNSHNMTLLFWISYITDLYLIFHILKQILFLSYITAISMWRYYLPSTKYLWRILKRR